MAIKILVIESIFAHFCVLAMILCDLFDHRPDKGEWKWIIWTLIVLGVSLGNTLYVLTHGM